MGVNGSACYLTLLLAAASLGAQYIGADACRGCHPAQFTSQSQTGHAQALSAAARHNLAQSFTPGDLRIGSYRFQFALNGNRLRVRATDGKDVVDIPVEWAFGAGSQAVTFVTRLDADWYLEHSLSYYSGLKAMSPTPGQELSTASLKLAMGRPYPVSDPKNGVLACFECHSTGPVSESRDSGLNPSEPGVHCEACHGPGGEHRTLAARGEPSRLAIGNPKRLPASGLNQFCGKCHRPPAPDRSSIDWNQAWNVRHQPLYLDQSACFRKSNGALSCLTCHEPHRGLRADAAFYNQKCAACHNSRTIPPSRVCASGTAGGCVTCHMPRVSPQAALRFTNHWIGVYETGAKLKPRR